MNFFENPYIIVVNLDRKVAKRSRKYTRKYRIKPADAVHLATAVVSNSDILYTYNENDLISIEDVPIEISEPKWIGQRELGLGE